MNRQTLLSAWLTQSTPSGKASALSFSGPILASYGCRIAELGPGRVVRMCVPGRSSQTTTIHINSARRAALGVGLTVVEAPDRT